MVESVRVPGIGRIGESTENYPSEYRKRLNLCEYRKTVESVRVQEIGRIRASPGMGRIRESIKNCPGEYRKIVESV